MEKKTYLFCELFTIGTGNGLENEKNGYLLPKTNKSKKEKTIVEPH